MKRIVFMIVAAALTFATPAFAGKHCWTQCRSDGSGICDTFCD